MLKCNDHYGVDEVMPEWCVCSRN
jgi:hypothetical protein